MARHRLDGFKRLALATTATTYLLILVGGLVRASGAGMGYPDWPKCSVGWPGIAHRNLALVVFAVAAWLLCLTHTTASPVPLQRAAISVLALATAQIAAGVALANLDLLRPAQVAHLSIASLLLGAETLLALLARRA